ncbi:MAG: antirestriction protein ArdA [Muribaculaceae bacterium]|nr:antirestriction protein ArdA [Muribaculaceae bacterium]
MYLYNIVVTYKRHGVVFTKWDSEGDFARHIASECCNLQLIDRMGDNLERDMGDLARYFDYEAFGRDLFMYGYTMGANGNVFRVV